MRIAMIGSGYVGLVSGACFAEFGNDVVCVDIDADKIDRLNRGEAPIYEPGLEDLVTRNRSAGRLGFSTDFAGSVAGRDLVFIAVGTPTRAEDGHADLRHVYDAAADIGRAIGDYTVIVDKSTVPVGTARKVHEIVAKETSVPFDVVSNPEFLREGAAIEDFMNPDRVVIGAESARARNLMRTLYAPLLDHGVPILITGVETAEIIKYASNAFLAIKVTFINEMADLCEKVGGNIDDVARGLGLDDRIGPKFLRAGPGYGGSCFPKDTLALARTAQDVGAPTKIVEAVIARNEERKRSMAARVIEASGGSVEGKSIAVLGLTFKPDTDDMRESPSIDLIQGLTAAGATVRAYDPKGMEQARRLMNGMVICDGPYEAVEGADAVVLATEWKEFSALDMKRVKAALTSPVFVDLRNLYDADRMAEYGFAYHSIGRPPVAAAGAKP